MKEKEDLIAKVKLLFEQLKKHSHGLKDFEEFIQDLEPYYNQTIEKKDKPGARWLLRDFNSDLRDGFMTSQTLKIRERILKDSGIDIFEGLRKDIDNIEAIVKRGKIRNLAEYAMVNEALNSIGGLSESDARAEAGILNALLVDYHKRTPNLTAGWQN